ncbi:MAG: hypothetical protein KatS3mg102_0171 [Planctomycetota bacterium]|nr:MAG: hypothetical protein KatS3mg102_0171 [Planctomycetota bacterium]
MAKAIDIGTSFIVAAELQDGREVFRSERNAFFCMDRDELAQDMLDDAGARYLVRGEQLFVVGEDALKFATITGDQRAYRRPMARGILNPGEEQAISMLETLVEGLLGPAARPGEVCAATLPAAPCDAEGDITFHRIVIERCLRRLGYEPHPIHEALAVIYSENPQVESGGQSVPFTGIGLSFGAGMTNAALAWRAKSLFETAVARGGDWIDERVALARATTRSKVCAIKERRLDLERIDPRDGMQLALEIYHEELIEYAARRLAEALHHTQASVEEALEVCVAGGTAMVPGFLPRLERALGRVHLPLQIRGVRLARDPLRAAAAGALVAAVSHEKRRPAGRAEGASAAAPAAPGVTSSPGGTNGGASGTPPASLPPGAARERPRKAPVG